MHEHDQVDKNEVPMSGEASVGRSKSTYQAPKLERYGSITQLTQDRRRRCRRRRKGGRRRDGGGNPRTKC